MIFTIYVGGNAFGNRIRPQIWTDMRSNTWKRACTSRRTEIIFLSKSISSANIIYEYDPAHQQKGRVHHNPQELPESRTWKWIRPEWPSMEMIGLIYLRDAHATIYAKWLYLVIFCLFVYSNTFEGNHMKKQIEAELRTGFSFSDISPRTWGTRNNEHIVSSETYGCWLSRITTLLHNPNDHVLITAWKKYANICFNGLHMEQL